MEAFRAIAPVFPETKISVSFRQLISQPDLLVPAVATNSIYSTKGQPIGFRLLWEIEQNQ
jgi:hypothetical protein